MSKKGRTGMTENVAFWLNFGHLVPKWGVWYYCGHHKWVVLSLVEGSTWAPLNEQEGKNRND